MPITVVTGPDGKEYDVTHPEGASDEDIINYAKANYGGGAAAPQAAAPAPVTKPVAKPAQVEEPSLLGGAVQGVGQGISNLVQSVPAMAKMIGNDISTAKRMFTNPSDIPAILAGTARNAAPLVEPKMLAGMAGGVAGSMVGAPTAGATAGAVTYQGLHDILQNILGGRVSPGEAMKNLTETATSFAAPPIVGKAGAKVVGAGTRAAAKAFPGSASALQQDVLERVRNLVSGAPRPPVPEDPAVIAARRAAGAGQLEAATAADEAAYQAALKQAQSAGVNRIKEAGMIPYVENPYALFDELQQGKANLVVDSLAKSGMEGPITLSGPVTARGGIPVETLPVGAVSEALGGTIDVLKPLIAAWKLSPNPNLVKSATALEKSLATTGTTMSLPDVVRFMRDVGKLTNRGGEVGGAAKKLYGAAIEDLKAHGSEAALAALEAAKQYKRKVAVGTIQDALAKSIRSKGGELVPSPDNLLRVLQSPSSRGEKFFMKRIKESLTAEEQATLIEDLKGALRRPEKPAPRPGLTPEPPQPPAIKSLQEVAEGAKSPVQGTSGTNVDIEKILKQLPSEGAIAEESPLAEFLRGQMASEDVAGLRGELENLQGVKRVTGGTPSYLERLPVYMFLAPILAKLGLGAMGGGGGAAALSIPASILAAEAATRGLKAAASTPTMQRALLRAYRNRMGESGPSLGGPTAGLVSEARKAQGQTERRKGRGTR